MRSFVSKGKKEIVSTKRSRSFSTFVTDVTGEGDQPDMSCISSESNTSSSVLQEDTGSRDIPDIMSLIGPDPIYSSTYCTKASGEGDVPNIEANYCQENKLEEYVLTKHSKHSFFEKVGEI